MPLLSDLCFCSPVSSLLSLSHPENDPRGHSVRSGLSADVHLLIFTLIQVKVRVLRTQSQHRCVCAPRSPEPERGDVKQRVSSPSAHPSERADDERERGRDPASNCRSAVMKCWTLRGLRESFD